MNKIRTLSKLKKSMMLKMMKNSEKKDKDKRANRSNLRTVRKWIEKTGARPTLRLGLGQEVDLDQKTTTLRKIRGANSLQFLRI